MRKNRAIAKLKCKSRVFKIEREKIESQIANVDSQIEQKKTGIRSNDIQIGVLEAKINTIPSVAVALESIQPTSINPAKRSYDDLLKKRKRYGASTQPGTRMSRVKRFG